MHVFFDIPPNVDDDNENPARPRDNRRRLKIGKTDDKEEGQKM